MSEKTKIQNTSHNIIFVISITFLFFFLGLATYKTIYQYTSGTYDTTITFLGITINTISVFTFGIFSLVYFLKRFKWKFLILMIPLFALYDIIWNITAIVHFGINCMELTTYNHNSFVTYVIILVSFSLGALSISDIKIRLPTVKEILPFGIFLIIYVLLYTFPQQLDCNGLTFLIGKIQPITLNSIKLSILGIFIQITYLISFRNIFLEDKEEDKAIVNK